MFLITNEHTKKCVLHKCLQTKLAQMHGHNVHKIVGACKYLDRSLGDVDRECVLHDVLKVFVFLRSSFVWNSLTSSKSLCQELSLNSGSARDHVRWYSRIASQYNFIVNIAFEFRNISALDKH